MCFTSKYKVKHRDTVDRLLQQFTNILYIYNTDFSRRDRPHNIGITTLLFKIYVCVLLSTSIEVRETGATV